MESMFEFHAVPYFPLKLHSEGDSWAIRNPLSDEQHELNSSAAALLGLCDGFRTFGEITSELGQAFRTSRDEVCRLSEPVLSDLTDDGVIDDASYE